MHLSPGERVTLGKHPLRAYGNVEAKVTAPVPHGDSYPEYRQAAWNYPDGDRRSTSATVRGLGDLRCACRSIWGSLTSMVQQFGSLGRTAPWGINPRNL